MSSLKLTPQPLTGELSIPASKSMSHRSVICAALANGTSQIDNLVFSDDIHMTLDAMAALGAEIERGENNVVITGLGKPKDGECSENYPALEIYSKESGSTLRFLIPLAAALGGKYKFTGSGRLVERPLSAYMKIFEEQHLPYAYEGKLPLEISGRLKPQRFEVEGKESSQYVSGLLMAMPMMAAGQAEVVVKGELESEDYVALTMNMMAHYGVVVTQDHRGTERIYRLQHCEKSTAYRAKAYTVEADYSQGAFFLVAGQIGQPVFCKGLAQCSKQADRRVVDIIQSMGGQLEMSEKGIVSKPTRTHGTVIDAAQCPDIIPVLCVLAAVSSGETRVINGKRLRIKESDRIKSTVSELSKLGACIEETPDGMIIQGVPMLKGGVVEGWNDHRIVMAMAIASIRCQNPVIIKGVEAVNKSYPHFFDDFVHLAGQVEHTDELEDLS